MRVMGQKYHISSYSDYPKKKCSGLRDVYKQCILTMHAPEHQPTESSDSPKRDAYLPTIYAKNKNTGVRTAIVLCPAESDQTFTNIISVKKDRDDVDHATEVIVPFSSYREFKESIIGKPQFRYLTERYDIGQECEIYVTTAYILWDVNKVEHLSISTGDVDVICNDKITLPYTDYKFFKRVV